MNIELGGAIRSLQLFGSLFRQKQVKMDCERHLILMHCSKPTPPTRGPCGVGELNLQRWRQMSHKEMTLASTLCPSSSTAPNASLTFNTLLFEVTTPPPNLLMQGVMLVLGPVLERQAGCVRRRTVPRTQE